MNKFKCFILLFVVFIASSCRNTIKINNRNFINSLIGKPIIPNKIKWDTLRISDAQLDSFANYKTYYFYNDSIAFMFRCINKCYKDSILFAVENVEEFKAEYKINDNGVIILKMRRVAETPIDENSSYNVFNDTLNLNTENIHSLFYKNDRFKVADKFLKGSYKRLNDFIK